MIPWSQNFGIFNTNICAKSKPYSKMNVNQVSVWRKWGGGGLACIKPSNTTPLKKGYICLMFSSQGIQYTSSCPKNNCPGSTFSVDNHRAMDLLTCFMDSR